MKRNYKLVGLDCAHCASKMEDGIKKIDGVINANVNFMTTRLVLEFDDAKLEEIIPQVEKAVKRVDNDVEMKRA